MIVITQYCRNAPYIGGDLSFSAFENHEFVGKDKRSRNYSYYKVKKKMTMLMNMSPLAEFQTIARHCHSSHKAALLAIKHRVHLRGCNGTTLKSSVYADFYFFFHGD